MRHNAAQRLGNAGQGVSGARRATGVSHVTRLAQAHPAVRAVAGALLAAGLGGLSAAPCLAQPSAKSPTPELSGELRLRADARQANPASPLAAAERLQAGTAPPEPDSAQAEAELRSQWHRGPWAMQGQLLAWGLWPEGRNGQQGLRVNALHLSLDAGAWQASAGKKLVEWDVGFGFRPNDVVQQGARRTLSTGSTEGRPLLQLEHFSAQDAFSLVWANPQRLNASAAHSRQGEESALAARWYRHSGALDLHGFARWGRHSRASLGAALAWVATDELAWHASLRALARHEAWHSNAPGAEPLPANPWQPAWRGTTGQALLGAQWTGRAQQSLLVEAWHDGTAPSRATWRAWGARNAGLLAASQAHSAPLLPAAAWAGNLAWQNSPWQGANLQRDSLFARLAWQPEGWQLAIDTLWHPADRGRIHTASLSRQGNAWRIDAWWRSFGGPADAVLAQLPNRRQLAMVATRAF